MAVLDLTAILFFGFYRESSPQGVLIYIHCFFFLPVVMWIAKMFSDSESTRYSLFLVFSASGSIAFVFAAVAPWFFPLMFWGHKIEVCRNVAMFEPTA